MLEDGQEEIWTDTLAIMGWDVDETGLGVVFDRSIPEFTEKNLAGAAKSALSRAGYERSDIDRFVCHPGGAKVIEAIETALDLEPESLDAERSVLRDYGNMSAPTVLFVLHRIIEQKRTGKMMLCALGPGFSASFLPLQIGAANA
jgi:alkylresorcinol/alkylpyrone synthase